MVCKAREMIYLTSLDFQTVAPSTVSLWCYVNSSMGLHGVLGLTRGEHVAFNKCLCGMTQPYLHDDKMSQQKKMRNSNFCTLCWDMGYGHSELPKLCVNNYVILQINLQSKIYINKLRILYGFKIIVYGNPSCWPNVDLQ